MLGTSPPTALGDGRYQLRAQLGTGGMATVWRAWDTRLEVDRAIKVLDPSRSYSKAKKRFANEARAMARLAHPNVVTVHDIVVDADGPPYIVMELANGGTLHQRVQDRGPLGRDEAVSLVRPLLDALQVAHDHGIVHRDIKPSNVLLHDGTPKLADFGIAQLADTEETLTAAGATLGTLSYMSPEQEVDARHVDGRTDVYSIGATLYHLVTGTSPRGLQSARTPDDIRFAEVPPPLRPIIWRSTRPEPSARYQTCSEMGFALDGEERRASLAPVWWGCGAAVVTMLAVGGASGALVFTLTTSIDPTPDPIPVTEPVGPDAQPAPDERPEPVAPPAEPTDSDMPAEPPAAIPAPSSTPPATAPPPPPDPGEVTQGPVAINSLPPSRIVIDGVEVGATPWQGTLSIGRHEVVLTADDDHTTRHEITVTEETPARLCWDFRSESPCKRR